MTNSREQQELSASVKLAALCIILTDKKFPSKQQKVPRKSSIVVKKLHLQTIESSQEDIRPIPWGGSTNSCGDVLTLIAVTLIKK